MSLYDAAIAELTGWRPPDPVQARLRDLFVAHLLDHPHGLTRDCHPDHLTAGLLVVSHDRSRVLLNLHGRYRRWMQFGGHCESDDATLADAALREGTEESGVTGLRLVDPQPAQLSRHEVSCGPLRPAHHLDVRFVAVAPAGAVGAASAESIEVGWFEVTAPPPDLEPEVRDLIRIAARG